MLDCHYLHTEQTLYRLTMKLEFPKQLTIIWSGQGIINYTKRKVCEGTKN